MGDNLKIMRSEDVCGVKAPGYNYIFRKSDGFAMRWGKTKDEDPFWGPAPELADISISNRCFPCIMMINNNERYKV